MKIQKENVFSNLFWRFGERFGAQFISLFVSIILARLLLPEDYGTIALVNVFITILNVFVDSGMGTALVQKYDADDLDFSTVFFFNVTACFIIYLGLFFASPWIAEFYHDSALTPIIRVVGITILISGVKNIQHAYVARHMMFKKFFYATIIGTLVSAVVGVAVAYAGGGVWALVAQHLTNLSMDAVILWITVKWRPKWMFSWERFRRLFSYGSRMLLSGLVDTVYQDLRQLIIGKKYSSEDLAFYNRGDQFPGLLATNLNASIDSVLLPTMAASQKQPEELKNITRRSMKTSSFVIWPMMVGLAVCAEPLTRLLLTEKWLPVVPYMRICCVTYAIYPIHTCNLNAIKAMGRSDIFLKLEIEKKIVGLCILLFAMWHGVLFMAYSLILSSAISSFINAHPNKVLLHYSYPEQLKDLLPPMLLAGIMGAIVYSITFLGLPDLATLLIQVPVGVIVYISCAKIFKYESFDYLLSLLKGLSKKEKNH